MPSTSAASGFARVVRPDGPTAVGLATLSLACLLLGAGTVFGWGIGLGLLLFVVSAVLAAVLLVRRMAESSAARFRRSLAAGLSHDVRTPLAQIRMFTEMLLTERFHSPAERSNWLESIDREAHRLGDLLENLFLFVHSEDVDPFPARRRLDLGDLAEDVAVAFVRRAAEHDSTIEVDPPAGLQVIADPVALRQALVNLIDNALRFGARGQRVLVSLTAGGGDVVVSVRDRGPGIPPQYRQAVWLPFIRVNEEGHGAGGGGLGLAVVQRVVQSHGGRVWIDDAPGGGAEVSFSLPLASDVAPTTRALEPTRAEAAD